MKLTTSIIIPESLKKISVSNRILCLGSCFSENMGNLLERLPMTILNQPLGTLFHPFSIQRSLTPLELNGDECVSQDDFFVHPDFHSQFTSPSKVDLIKRLEQVKTESIEFCQKTNWLLITWGTAFYYYDKTLGRPIANCHKQRNTQFEKRLSTVEELTSQTFEFFEGLQKKNPQLKIILTVSPVRHTKDGMQENSISKSTLRVAAAEICQKLDFVHYFPSYEIMMDELRDYRFYAADLIHPNEVAINYIWDLFKRCFFDLDLIELEKKWTNYLVSIHHRVQKEKQSIHNELLMKMIDEIKTNYSHLPIHKMVELINSRILAIS